MGGRTKKSDLVTQIYESLRQDIIGLRMKPGEFLTERQISEIYDASPTSVRGALSLLKHDGLVKVFPHKGYMVSEITLEDMRNLFQFRSVLENANIYYAAQYAEKEQLDHLEFLAEGQETSLEPETHSNQTEPNTEFHLYLAQITGNPILLEQLINTIEKLQRLSWMGTPHKFTPASVDEHREIVKLIRTKQVFEAQDLMRKHINQVFEIAVSKTLKKVF